MESRHGTTRALQRWASGDETALDELLPALYDELRRLARSYMSRQPKGHTLPPTALVNEAYLKLAGGEGLSFRDRAGFLALAARAMRQVLVDHARARGAAKRRGARVTLVEGLGGTTERPADVQELDAALEALARQDERKSRVVEMKYFGGLTGEEIASALGVGTATVTRDLRLAEAWLRREMTRERERQPPARS